MKDTTIVLGGEAGQGIATVENLLAGLFKSAGFHIHASKEYMSRVRGGINTTTIRIADEHIWAYKHMADFMVPLGPGVVDWASERITPDTVIVAEKEFLDSEECGKCLSKEVSFTEIAEEAGKKIAANTVVAGFFAGVFDLDESCISETVEKIFSDKDENILELNRKAAELGYAEGEKLRKELSKDLPRPADAKDDVLINGTEAVSLGAAAAGCRFTSFYPMSPSTGVSTKLTEFADKMGIVSEQFEDEIAAANANIGAWYAGARALTSTSGGGFALMGEAVSLAGMSETPMLIHLAQRPGPATGLPTRTMQGDLELALYSGHGEFPRAIFAPGDLQEAVSVTAHAFDVADKYQTPAVVLTDEYFVDSYYNVSDIKTENISSENRIVKTDKDYQRYKFTENGISPRGVPGNGDGIVLANGNEHDENGDTIEEQYLSETMPEKRMTKIEQMAFDALEPTFFGDEDYHTLIICWGSMKPMVFEAVKGKKGYGALHFSQVYPLSGKLYEYLDKAEKMICIEQNVTGQFAKLLHLEFDILPDSFLKYDGRVMSVEEICELLDELEEDNEQK